jgi:pimeloyl-ACP methyl ester carboxylesterase
MLMLLAVTVAVLATPAAAQATVAWAPCAEPSAPTLQCGAVTVPLDRRAAVPGAVTLNVRRLPATTAPSDTAVLALAGGPGQAAAPLTPVFGQILAPGRATRDLLVMDQRGTGRSGLLTCHALSTPKARTSLVDAGRRCSQQLGARRGLYRTSDSVADIEALRAQAGYAKLAIYAVSYGTKVALAYASAYPDRVERLVLDSVVAPDGPDVLQRSTFAAIPRVLGELCAAGACAGITNDPTATLRALVRKLQRRPLHGRWVDSHGRVRRVEITRQRLLSALLHGDTNPALRADVPAALGAWRRGDNGPLARIIAHAGGRVTLAAPDASVAPALYAATLCEELNFPWSRSAGVRTRARQAAQVIRDLPPADFAPFDRETALGSELLALCAGWRNATAGPLPVGSLPAVPTLILSGGADLRTPTEDARATAARMPLPPQIVTVPWVGHSVLSSELAREACAAHALAAFFAAQAIPGCTTQHAPIANAPRPPSRLAGQRTIGTLRGRLGRTVGAVLDTLTDLRRQVLYEALETGAVPARVGALRGGFASVSSAGIRLRAARYVHGVRVAGWAPYDGTSELHVRGGGAMRGTIWISADMQHISGRLGGRRFSIVRSVAASRGQRVPSVSDALRASALRGLASG